MSPSLCLRVWVDDVVCVVSLSFFFEETKLRANRTPHTPRTCCCFFFPRRFALFGCFGSASFLFWFFFRGAILGPVRFLVSLGTALRLFFGREAVEVFALFWSVVFPVLRLHTSRRPPRHSMPQGVRQQVVSLAPWGSGPQVQCPSRAGGLRPPPVWFLFVASICFGSQGPKSLIVRWGNCCVAPRLSHARFFFPRSLSLSYIYMLAGPRGPEWRARCIGRLQWTNAERCSKNSRKSPVVGCAVFPSYFRIFQSSICLMFFSEDVAL